MANAALDRPPLCELQLAPHHLGGRPCFGKPFTHSRLLCVKSFIHSFTVLCCARAVTSASTDKVRHSLASTPPY